MPTESLTMDLESAEFVDIDSVRTHPENFRKGNIKGIKDSLKRFGQVRPIIVQGSTGYIIAGNHTWKAAKELGFDKIAVIEVNLDDDDALAYMIADNRLPDTGSYDDESLIEALEKLQADSSLHGTGYSVDDLDDLSAALNRVAETAPEPFQGGYAEAPEETAKRYEGHNEGQRVEIVFLLPVDKQESFMANLEKLKKKYDLDKMSDVIYEAVAREAI